MPLTRPSNRKSRSHLTIDTKAIDRFIRTDLADRFQAANEAGAEYVADYIAPVLYGRLAGSSRAIDVAVIQKLVKSGITLGGVSSYGIYGEQAMLRDVDYGLIREIRKPYLRPALPEIGAVIVDRMKRKR